MKFFPHARNKVNHEVKKGLYQTETWITVTRANVIFSVYSKMRWNPSIQNLVRNKQSH